MNRIKLIIALLLPVVAIVGLILRAELLVQTGKLWLVRVNGYDPRDLLRGHYLTYRMSWQMQGADQCEGDSCCYCLWNPGQQTGDQPVEPAVRVVSCSQRAPCESWFRKSELPNLERFYIPEGDGGPLDRALRERQREVLLLISVSASGRAGIKELMIDKRPFREWLKDGSSAPK